MPPEQNLLSLLLWHLDASDREMKEINVTREDVLRLARTYEHLLPDGRREQLALQGKCVLIAYRHGQMDGPRSTPTK